MNEKRSQARKLVNGYFLVEGLNSFATTLYFYYIYWFTGQTFGFTQVQNFLLAAAIGLIYGVASVLGGRFAQRRGYFSALKLGCAVMALAIAPGAFILSLPVHCIIVFIGVCGMALTWPSLEALVSEGDAPEHLPRNIGIYNLVWAASGALAYFLGGSMIKAWSFRSLFLVPAAIFVLQLVIIALLERAKRLQPQPAHHALPSALPDEEEGERSRSPVPPITFLRMAWLANPLAYLTIGTVVAVIPALANNLKLSVAWAGIICSIWQFVRAGSFVVLWQWKGWHYRFRWLVAAYVAMAASFVTILIAPSLAVIIVAQIFFGLGTGLIYYSSLYYSMHVGEARGDHGGVHEGMIGVGSCAGPAISAASLHLLPSHANSGAVAVAMVLFGGWGALMWLRYSKRRPITA